MRLRFSWRYLIFFLNCRLLCSPKCKCYKNRCIIFSYTSWNTYSHLFINVFQICLLCTFCSNVLSHQLIIDYFALYFFVSVNISVISKFGASGDYPPCTDRAYNKAILDGVDILDCPVQLSKDGVPFCISSIDLIESSTVAQSNLSRLATTIPEIKTGSGIYSFSLTSNDITTLTRKSEKVPYHLL